MKFEWSDLLTHPTVAAAVGAIVGLKALPGSSYVEKAGNVGAGFALAAFGGPAMVESMGIVSAKVGAGVVFVIGAAGLVVFNAAIEAIKRSDAFTRAIDWALSLLPGKRGQ